MSSIDYVNTLGAGAGFNTKEIITALVDAERAGKKSIIDAKIDDNEAQNKRAWHRCIKSLGPASGSDKAQR